MPPALFLDWGRKWASLHPDWEYKLWREADIAALDPDAYAVMQKCEGPAVAADVARAAIVAKLGGVYLDMDFEPVRPLDALLTAPAFRVDMSETGEVANAVFGACPGHPWPVEVRRLFLKYAADRRPLWHVGITKAVAEASGVGSLPHTLFYPYHFRDRGKHYDRPATTWPEAYAVHRWATSWSTYVETPSLMPLFRRMSYTYKPPGPVPQIPKVIHQILLPHHRTDNRHLWERSEWMRETWRKVHPDWEYRLWTDEGELRGKMVAGSVYYANRNPAHRADILRYEILHAMGGVYADIDVACYKRFDPLLGHSAFIGGLKEVHYNPDPRDPTLHQTVEIAVLGSRPGHPFFLRLLNGILTRRKQYGPDFWAVPLTRRTGPFWFESNLNELGGPGVVDLAVTPGDFFYPTDFRHLGEPEKWVAEQHTKADAYCRHYWWGSWYKHSPLVHENGRSDPMVGAES